MTVWDQMFKIAVEVGSSFPYALGSLLSTRFLLMAAKFPNKIPNTCKDGGLNVSCGTANGNQSERLTPFQAWPEWCLSLP